MSLPGDCWFQPNRLGAAYDEFAPAVQKFLPDFTKSSQLRDQFAETIAPRFGVNSQVIEVRLDRDGIWPAV